MEHTEALSKAAAVEMYRRMRLIRRFEETVVELVNANEIAGVAHEYVGQEAVAVGVCSALRPDDVITSTHRGHGHLIAKGGDPRQMLAELLGRESGYNRGRGGSMHIADLSLGVYGANGIVAAGVPMACGAAYCARLRGQGRVAVAFFGDGAINQGVLHESLNLAAVWSLPVLFVCENNLYAITTPLSSVSKLPIHERASTYGMPSEAVDGMDVGAVYAAAARLVGRARAGGGPAFLECRTYRFFGHQTAERALKLGYRTDEEVEQWRRSDPLQLWARRLAETDQLSADERAEVDASVDAQLEAAVRFARESPPPSPDSAFDFMYATAHPELPVRGWA